MVVVHVHALHALNETFATLTGGSPGFRVDTDLAARLIREQIIARATMIVLDAEEVTAALGKARAHGVRGGAVYTKQMNSTGHTSSFDFVISPQSTASAWTC